MSQLSEAGCREEVISLHRFFEAWFKGAIASSDDTFSRLTRSLAASFRLISPDGRISERDALVSGLRSAYGSREGEEPPFRIWIENVTVQPLGDVLFLVTYVEWQDIAGSIRARLSTALLQGRRGRADHPAWLHVHETWLGH